MSGKSHMSWQHTRTQFKQAGTVGKDDRGGLAQVVAPLRGPFGGRLGNGVVQCTITSYASLRL